ncbi:NAD(P)-dependent oxidoreductase [Actinopolymorpha sp. B11F2]|uniref:NAD-dependent epimerase/dehydratase family protein n=1 Tax=Actinopolymorpha sp. B11F2 TaxID=3160862 RepID=UPI0032E43EF2
MGDDAPRILLTGAAGRIGTSLRDTLSDYRLHLHDRDPSGVQARPNEMVFEGDIADFAGVQKAAAGCDAVIHLAADPRVSAPWDDLRSPNFDGAYHVFESARLAGARRLVFASTNHVTGMLDQQERWPLDPGGDIAPDSLYGASKAFGEALGRYYAETSDLSVVCLRIGWVLERYLPDNAGWRRMWLSFRDLGQLVRKSLTADVRFGIYYGVSANTPMRYDLENARRELGYEPVDDSARIVAELAWSKDASQP